MEKLYSSKTVMFENGWWEKMHRTHPPLRGSTLAPTDNNVSSLCQPAGLASVRCGANSVTAVLK